MTNLDNAVTELKELSFSVDNHLIYDYIHTPMLELDDMVAENSQMIDADISVEGVKQDLRVLTLVKRLKQAMTSEEILKSLNLDS